MFMDNVIAELEQCCDLFPFLPPVALPDTAAHCSARRMAVPTFPHSCGKPRCALGRSSGASAEKPKDNVTTGMLPFVTSHAALCLFSLTLPFSPSPLSPPLPPAPPRPVSAAAALPLWERGRERVLCASRAEGLQTQSAAAVEAGQRSRVLRFCLCSLSFFAAPFRRCRGWPLQRAVD